MFQLILLSDMIRLHAAPDLLSFSSLQFSEGVEETRVASVERREEYEEY